MTFYYFHFEWVKKEIVLQQVQGSPQDFLSTSPLPLSPPPPPPASLLFFHWNLWEKQANSLGPICVHNPRFYCNSCKVVLQQWEIVKRLPWCTHSASYYVLFSRWKLELLILWVKLTIFIKYLGVTQIVSRVTAKCSNATQLVILDQRCNFQRLHAHRLQHFYEVFHYSFLWYLMIGGVAEREAQSGQLITDPASSRKREMGYLREIALRLIYTSHLVFCSSCLIWESPTNQPLASTEPHV